MTNNTFHVCLYINAHPAEISKISSTNGGRGLNGGPKYSGKTDDDPRGLTIEVTIIDG